MANGVLAGSVLTLDRALQNLIAFTGASVEHGLRALSGNAAAMTGLENSAGSLAVGQPANLVAINGDGKLMASINRGVMVAG
jgi:N-acetylglucosamine-6-phosphate deacetylase